MRHHYRFPRPALRPLARSLLVAMALVPAATVAAGDLDNEHKIVGSGDPVEEWTLRNWSLLRVQGGETNAIQANNSDVLALDAIVRRSGTHQVAIDLSGDSSLQLGTSTVRGGGIRVSGSSNAHLIGSRILVTAADGLSPTESLSIGLSMGGTPASAPLPGAWAIIDSTYMRVEDTTAGNDIASGLGVRMQNGKISIINGSRIDADNVGVLMIGTRNTPDTLQLAVDGSRSRLAAAPPSV